MLTGGENLSAKIRQFKNVLKKKVSDPKKVDDIVWALKAMEAIGKAFEKANEKAKQIEVVFDPPLEAGAA